MTPSIVAEGVSKSFSLPRLPARTTLKDHVSSGSAFRLDRQRRIVHALSSISFSTKKGEMLGVIGQNGSGKTTLLRVLAGVYAPDSGHVRIDGRITPLLALGAGFHPDLTGRENARIELLVMGIARKSLDRYLDEIVDFSEIGEFFDLPLRMYSSGMAMRLAFATATVADLDVLLIDEALAVGDDRFAAKCLARIDRYRDAGKTIVLVTHQSRTLVERCDAALWLDAGRVAAFGRVDDVVSVYEDWSASRAPQRSA